MTSPFHKPHGRRQPLISEAWHDGGMTPNKVKRPGDKCHRILRNYFHAQDTEVHVSTEPPLVIGPYTTSGLTCPHGLTYWCEPTGEQIAEWVRDKVE